MKASLDRIDRRILHALMHDATVPIAQLAERVGLSQSPCWKRVQKLEASGVITGRVALVDPTAIGLGLTVFVEIVAADHTPDWRTGFNAVMAEWSEVVEVHRMAGSVDYLLKVTVADMHAFDTFYQRLTQAIPCRSVVSKVSMERIKATTAWTINIVDP